MSGQHAIAQLPNANATAPARRTILHALRPACVWQMMKDAAIL